MNIFNSQKPCKENIKQLKSFKIDNDKISRPTYASKSNVSNLHKSIFKPKKPTTLVTGKEITLKVKLTTTAVNKYASPTDRLLSPCSQKLNDYKTKFLLAKSNPTKLAFNTNKMKNNSDEEDDDDEA